MKTRYSKRLNRRMTTKESLEIFFLELFRRTRGIIKIHLLFILLFLSSFTLNTAQAAPLPELGDPVSAIFSPEKETQLASTLLRTLRTQIPIIYDPLLNTYVEDLVYRLASVSELDEPNLQIVIVNSAQINAFAMPGGVLGINAGLFLHASNEDELAAVIAHELAHLSQRHFARSLENRDRNKWTTLTALIASVALIASTGSGDAGLAALATTQAVAIDSRLRFSRHNEMESDRVGMHTLVKAGFDPYAMPRFFEHLMKSQQFADENHYEFLRTHPVTQSRIADSLSRAENMEKPKRTPELLEFKLMQARVLAAYAQTPQHAIDDFKAQLNQNARTQTNPALEYGLARALLANRKFSEANQLIKKLRTNDPNRITYIYTEAEILKKQKKYSKMIQLLSIQLSLNPENFSLGMLLSEALVHEKKGEEAVQLLQKIIYARPTSPIAWKLLGEAYALTKNRVGIHLAEAEAHYLRGANNEAIAQLKYALDLVPEKNLPMNVKIENRIRDFEAAKTPFSL